jgi:hypothetical protein
MTKLTQKAKLKASRPAAKISMKYAAESQPKESLKAKKMKKRRKSFAGEKLNIKIKPAKMAWRYQRRK